MAFLSYIKQGCVPSSGGWVLTKYHRVNPSLIWLRLGSDNYDILFLLYPLNIPNVSKYIIDTSPSNTFS